MKLLLHVCCAPCCIYPLKTLRQEGNDVMGFFYRRNIHPYTECLKRQKTLTAFGDQVGLKLIIEQGYDLEGFLQGMVFREKERCRFCYHARLTATALLAKRGQFDAFSTTLLYSRFQNHQLIQSVGEAVAKTIGVDFYYRDFRTGWEEGVASSREMNMYRQPYCGCIYSEKERYYR